MEKRLSIKDTIVYGFKIFFSRFWYFTGLLCLLLLLLILVALLVVPILLVGLFTTSILTKGVLIAILSLMVPFFINLFSMTFCLTFLLKMGLTTYDLGPHEVTLKKILSGITVKKIAKIIGCSALVWLIVVVGLLLLILPGIYLAIKLSFVPFYIIDTDCGIIDAIKKSYRITTGNFWRIFWVEFIGRLLWGTLILLPVGLLMQVYAYRWLQANKAEEVA